jgi:gliding motility-associated-like protein
MRLSTHIYCLFFVLISFAYRGQNLIQNGSFENHGTLSCNGAFIVNNWGASNSPDYYNAACPFPGYGIPKNYFGYQTAKNGNAYAGMVVYQITPNEYKEYVTQQLALPLDTGKTYCLSFFVSRSERVGYAIKNIGAFFSSFQPVISGSLSCLYATAQVENNSGYITDTIGWTEVSGYFTAIGGEQYITIGNFHSNQNTDTTWGGTNNNPFPGDPGTAYYYIDSVTLYQCTPPPDTTKPEPPFFIPNVFTPNGDSINDTWRVTLPKGAILNEVEIYNRWGNLIYRPDRSLIDIQTLNTILWDGRTTSGEKVNEGVYYYILEYTDKKGDKQKKNGYVSLFR